MNPPHELLLFINPPYTGFTSKVIPLKLFLDIVPSSSADITRALRVCFPGGSVYVVSFCFEAKENLQTLWGCLL